MSHYFRRIVFAAVGLLLAAGDLHAQGIDYRAAKRLGLTSAWAKTIATGYGGSITGVTLYASPTEDFNASDVVDKYGNRTFFSDRDLTLGVSRSGYDQTARRAKLKRLELEARGLSPEVQTRSIPSTTMYVSSSLGTVTAIDAETGEQKWETKIGKAWYANYPVSATDDHVVAMNGSTLYLLDAKTGVIMDDIPARSAPSNGPTLLGDKIYLPTTSGIIEVLALDDLKRREYTLGSAGRITTPISIGSRSVSWTTDQGYMYVANIGAPGIKYRFQSLDTISSKSVYMNGKLYATSIDGYAYAIDEGSGEVAWRYSAGGPVYTAPMALDGRVFVTTSEGQMTCLDGESGEVQWSATGIKDFLSASATRLYCMTTDHRLAVYDVSTGGQLGAVVVGTKNLPVQNSATDRLYLASDSGQLTCLREPTQRWPIVRRAIAAPKEEERGSEEAEEAAEESVPDVQVEVPSAEEPANTGDVFGDFGDTEAEPADVSPADDFGDPFGSDDDAEDLGTDEEDPFADI